MYCYNEITLTYSTVPLLVCLVLICPMTSPIFCASFKLLYFEGLHLFLLFYCRANFASSLIAFANFGSRFGRLLIIVLVFSPATVEAAHHLRFYEYYFLYISCYLCPIPFLPLVVVFDVVLWLIISCCAFELGIVFTDHGLMINTQLCL